MATDWAVRPFQPRDEAAIREIVVRSFDRGDLADWSRLDIQQLVGAIPGDSSGVVVGVAAGEVVGFVWPHQEQLFVHPDRRRRGHGTRLVAAGLDWVRGHGEVGLAVALPRGPAARPFAERLGFAYQSCLWRLRLPANRDVPAPSFPPEVVTFPATSGIDIRRYVEVVNRSFADHPSPITVNEAMIRRSHESPGFDPEDIRLVAPVESPHDLIAFCRTRMMDDAGERVGELALVGVMPEWRGRGLGRELLRWGVGRLRARAVAEPTLNVETRNDFALDLYERTGFVRVQEWPRWAKRVEG